MGGSVTDWAEKQALDIMDSVGSLENLMPSEHGILFNNIVSSLRAARDCARRETFEDAAKIADQMSDWEYEQRNSRVGALLDQVAINIRAALAALTSPESEKETQPPCDILYVGRVGGDRTQKIYTCRTHSCNFFRREFDPDSHEKVLYCDRATPDTEAKPQ
jgi:hypothetical protein